MHGTTHHARSTGSTLATGTLLVRTHSLGWAAAHTLSQVRPAQVGQAVRTLISVGNPIFEWVVVDGCNVPGRHLRKDKGTVQPKVSACQTGVQCVETIQSPARTSNTRVPRLP